jgi:hypothetical protein
MVRRLPWRTTVTTNRDDDLPADVQVSVNVADDRVAKCRGAAMGGDPLCLEGDGDLGGGPAECRQERQDRVSHAASSGTIRHAAAGGIRRPTEF